MEQEGQRDKWSIIPCTCIKLCTEKAHTVHAFLLLFSFNDDTNLEVTQAIERGVQATSAFKEADPVLLERKYKWYGYIYMYSGIWISQTFQGNKNWFKKLSVWDIRSKITMLDWVEGNNFWWKKSGGWRSQGFEKSRFHCILIYNVPDVTNWWSMTSISHWWVINE